jgi:hypothetical protein
MRCTRLVNAISQNSEGKGTVGCLVSLVLIGALIIFAVQAGPPYFAYKSLEGDVSTEISRAGSHFFNDEVLLQNILDVARKNEVRLKREDIKIERISGQVSVSIQYSVPVDLFLFQHTMLFNIKAKSFIGAL